MYGYIYKTTNLINGKIYIGQKRSKKFLAEKYLGSGKLLKQATAKEGIENFNVILIDVANSQEDLNNKEIFWISFYKSNNRDVGYNLCSGGQGIFDLDESSRSIMSEKAKNREHKPTTAGRKSMTNGKDNHMVKSEDFDRYIAMGYVFGKTMSGKPAWNKGLTKETDERVAKNAEKRKATMDANPELYKGGQNGFKKGNIPWNKGITGYSFGRIVSEETKKLISERTKGKKKKKRK